MLPGAWLLLTECCLIFVAGFEGTLCVSSFVDPQRVSMTNKASLPGKVIGSVKWPAYNSSQTAEHTYLSSLLGPSQVS